MSKARILAVDDQRYFRELIEGLLDDEGYDVQTVSSADEALHILEREDFDIVITDLVMPGMEGVELVRRIRERRPDQQVVMVTGVIDVKTAVDAMKQGATDYILKPFDRVELVESIEKILQQRRLSDEHARLVEENLEYMGVPSLFERARELFSSLSVGALAERLLEGLCFETRAQSGVVWIAEDLGRENLELAGARGLVWVEQEAESIRLAEAVAAWCPGLQQSRSVLAALPADLEGNEALYLPIRAAGRTVGIVRLSGRIDSEDFDEADRARAEKFCEFGGVAMHNAMRFRALERRSLRDPETRTYSRSYFDDAVRNEVHKANRFGHRFSIARVEIDDWTGPDGGGVPAGIDHEVVEAARRIEGALRATDLLAAGEDGAFLLLLPLTDALGAGVLTQRMRMALAAGWEGREAPTVRISSTTFPVDGSQLESLEQVLEARVDASRSSLLAQRPEFARFQALDPLLDCMLEFGSSEPVEVEGQIMRFVLEDIVRRPAERGVLFLSPGVRWLPDVLEALDEIRSPVCGAEIILLAEGEVRETNPQVTWVTKSALDSRRPFLVYFGDGPAYAMVGQLTLAAARTAVFQTSDRALIEFLAFELGRELGIVLSV
ncbi:MAG: response regulator [bacterium]|nr:response regulator [bacterium]